MHLRILSHRRKTILVFDAGRRHFYNIAVRVDNDFDFIVFVNDLASSGLGSGTAGVGDGAAFGAGVGVGAADAGVGADFVGVFGPGEGAVSGEGRSGYLRT